MENTISTTVVAIIAFFVVMLLLVSLLLYVKTKLTPAGKVKIDINKGTKTLEVSPGSSVLSTLLDSGIFLPSACGGGGTCGMCKCQVVSGGGTILPTEEGFFTRKQRAENWRLGCQVKVRDNLSLEIHKSVLGVKKWECEVVSNRSVSTFIKEFVVKLPEGEFLDFQSGGYIQIDVPKCTVDFSKDVSVEDAFRPAWDKMGIWNLVMKNSSPTFRAYSMANHPAEGNIIMLNIRIATPPWNRNHNCFEKTNPGICSSYIYSRKPGDKVTISGPYGEFFLRETNNEMMFIGGGAGMAPMRSHIFHLFHTLKTGRKVSFWYGARSKSEIFYEQDFRDIESKFPNFKFTIALSEPLPEDNWTGDVGFIHNVIANNYLNQHKRPEDIEYYMCGPPMMVNATTNMLDNLGVPADMVMYDNFGS